VVVGTTVVGISVDCAVETAVVDVARSLPMLNPEPPQAAKASAAKAIAAIRFPTP